MRKADPAPLDAFRIRWARQRDDFARFHAIVDAATLCGEMLADFDAAVAAAASVLLPLADAARVSGMHTDSLRRLARTGQLAVVRRGRRLYFRLGDLPCKTPRVDSIGHLGYDPVANAQLVADRRKHGE